MADIDIRLRTPEERAEYIERKMFEQIAEMACLRAELEAMKARKDGWRRAALYWRKEWGLFTSATIGRSYVTSYLVGRSVSQRNIRRKAGKE